MCERLNFLFSVGIKALKISIDHYQGGSRLSESRKIPEEIFRKSMTFSVTYCKKYKNQ